MEPDRLFRNAEPRELPELPPEDRLYTYAEVARYCMVSKQTLMEWVKMGKVESPRYLGTRARFTRDQMAAMAERTHPAGTFPVTPSPKSEVAKAALDQRREAERARVAAELAAQAERERAERERAEAALLAVARPARKLGAKKPAAKKPAAKKPAAKKPAAKKDQQPRKSAARS